MVNLLIGCTGSVATIKLPILVKDLLQQNSSDLEVKCVISLMCMLNLNEILRLR